MPERSGSCKDETDRPLRWDHLLCAVLFVIMTLIPFANVLSRFLLKKSWAFTEEITIHCFVYLMVLGSGLAFERGSHLGMTTLYERFPLRLKRGITALGALLAASLYLAVSFFLVRTIYAEITILKGQSPALGIPSWIYYAGVLPATLVVYRGIWRGMR